MAPRQHAPHRTRDSGRFPGFASTTSAGGSSPLVSIRVYDRDDQCPDNYGYENLGYIQNRLGT